MSQLPPPASSPPRLPGSRFGRRAATLGAGLLAASACGSGAAGGAHRVTDSAGVTIIESTAQDRPLSWNLTEVRRIGGDDTGAASFSHVSPWTVAVDHAGRIYVLDASSHRVVVFDTAGRVVWSVGRRGGGPGELQLPGVLWLTPDGTVEVADYVKGGFVRFGPGGEIVPEIRVTPGGESFPDEKLHRMQGASALVISARTESELAVRFLLRTDSDTAVLRELTIPTPGMAMFDCGVGLAMPPLFSRKLLTAASGSTLAVTAQVPYAVDFFQDGRWTRSVRRALTPPRADAAAAARLYPTGMRFRGRTQCVIPSSELYEKLGVAGDVPLVSALALAPDGTLWAERYTFADETPMVDVFDPDGAYAGTLTGYRVPLGFAGDLILFELTEEDTGIERIGIFRVIR